MYILCTLNSFNLVHMMSFDLRHFDVRRKSEVSNYSAINRKYNTFAVLISSSDERVERFVVVKI